MWIKSIFLEEFGKHLKKEINFNSTFNIFCADNEYGKTTIVSAIDAIYNGFRPANSSAYPYFPWNSNKLSLEATVEKNNIEYKINRKMSSKCSGSLHFLSDDIENTVKLDNKNLSCILNSELLDKTIWHIDHDNVNAKMSMMKFKTWRDLIGAVLFSEDNINFENTKVNIRNDYKKIYVNNKNSNSELNIMMKKLEKLENHLQFVIAEEDKRDELLEKYSNLNIELNEINYRISEIKTEIEELKIINKYLELKVEQDKNNLEIAKINAKANNREILLDNLIQDKLLSESYEKQIEDNNYKRFQNNNDIKSIEDEYTTIVLKYCNLLKKEYNENLDYIDHEITRLEVEVKKIDEKIENLRKKHSNSKLYIMLIIGVLSFVAFGNFSFDKYIKYLIMSFGILLIAIVYLLNRASNRKKTKSISNFRTNISEMEILINDLEREKEKIVVDYDTILREYSEVIEKHLIDEQYLDIYEYESSTEYLAKVKELELTRENYNIMSGYISKQNAELLVELEKVQIKMFDDERKAFEVYLTTDIDECKKIYSTQNFLLEKQDYLLNEITKIESLIISKNINIASNKYTSFDISIVANKLNLEMDDLYERKSDISRELGSIHEIMSNLISDSSILVKSQIDELNIDIIELKKRYDRLQFMQYLLDYTKDRIIINNQPEFVNFVNDYFSRLVGNDNRKIMISSSGEILIYDKLSFEIVDIESFSTGTISQLILLFKLAILNSIDPENEMPFVIDGLFGHFDLTRSSRMLDILKEISLNRQIIIFASHHIK